MSVCRIGVVGCGVIGAVHVRSCVQSAYAEVVAVADVREAAARKLAEQHGISKVYTDAQELFADPEVDAVVLALPANLRTPLALKALAHGKHVLIEKPIAMDAAEARRIIEAQGDRVVMCCQNRYEFMPSTRAAAKFVAGGALGRLRLIRVRGIAAPAGPPSAQPPVWRLRRDLNGGGIMANWGCYDLHYMLSLINWRVTPRTVLAQMWPVGGPFADYAAPGSDAETHLSMLVQCADGVAINYERGEFLAAAPEKAWEVIGEAGSLSLQMTPGKQKRVTFYRRDTGSGTASELVWEGDEDWKLAHQGTLDAFAMAVQGGRASAKPLRQAYFVQAVTEAAYRSSDERQAIGIDLADHGAALTPEELDQVPTASVAVDADAS